MKDVRSWELSATFAAGLILSVAAQLSGETDLGIGLRLCGGALLVAVAIRVLAGFAGLRRH